MFKILLIEDDILLAMEIQEAFRPGTHEILIAPSPAAALQFAQSEKIDLVVSDWNLGSKLNGIDVCIRIKALHPSVKIILASAVPSEYLKSIAGDLKPDAILSKPFERQMLTDIMFTITADATQELQKNSALTHCLCGIV